MKDKGQKLMRSALAGIVLTTVFFISLAVPIALLLIVVMGGSYLITGELMTPDLSALENIAYFYLFSVIAVSGIVYITQ